MDLTKAKHWNTNIRSIKKNFELNTKLDDKNYKASID